MAGTIEPRLLKGFRDTLPQDELLKATLERTLEKTFRSFGFVPIDTPVLEYAEILLGKGGGETDKQVYRFHDHGDRDVAMRFDLTVPFARFMATHERELASPFKRYHIAKVWRGENTQRGRYREFIQCDFDIVGIDHAGPDVEILMMMAQTLEALGVPGYTIHLAHRGLFNRFLARLGVEEHSVGILRAVDKLAKIGETGVRESLASLLDIATTEKVLEYITRSEDSDATLARMIELAGGPDEEAERLAAIMRMLSEVGVAEHIVLDPSITRGLDYYTGIVYETYLQGLESFGSICSGGRYNDLASLYTDRTIPGVGASIGLDRLVAALSEVDAFRINASIPQIVLFNLDDQLLPHYFSIALQLRRAGFSCDIEFVKRKLAQQFSRAEKLGAQIAIICGEDEHHRGVMNLRILATRENYDNLTIEQAIEKLSAFLHAAD